MTVTFYSQEVITYDTVCFNFLKTYIWKQGTEHSTTLELLIALANQPYLLTNTSNSEFVAKVLRNLVALETLQCGVGYIGQENRSTQRSVRHTDT
jgi:hypothetical protein